MAIYLFKEWCRKAVSGIRFPPDRVQVGTELYRHLEDRYEEFLSQGHSELEAQQLAVEAMGDAWAIAPQLAAIHHPFWGYFLRTTRILLISILIFTVVPFGRYLYRENFERADFFDYYNTADGFTQLFHDEPELSFTENGYTFTLREATQWHSEEYGTYTFCLILTEFHPLPWMEHGQAGVWIWARDSLGTVYESDQSHFPGSDTPVLSGFAVNTSPFSSTYQMWISDDLTDVQWLELRYDRDGRDYTMRIDLTGGDAP